MSSANQMPANGQPRRGIATASLVLGLLSIPTLGGLLVGAIAAIVLGIVALVRIERHPGAYVGKGRAIGGIVCGALGLLLTPFMGVIAAIAIPSLLQARVAANEAAAIADTRALISAQAAYQQVNGGLYADKLTCLAEPNRCIPGYNGAAFLDHDLASAETKAGYDRRLWPGAPGEGAPRDGSAGTGVSSYAYVAVPALRRRTGIRGFCGDSDGKLCYTTDGSAPRVTDGLCDLSTCTILQ